MKIAYLILAHDQPAQLAKLITLLLKNESEDCVFLHWDQRSRFNIGAYLEQQLAADMLSRTFLHSVVQVKWGMWSIVEATLCCIAHLLACERTFDYVILMSGHDYPIKPVATLKNFLSSHNGMEFIECVDADERRWVIGGIYKERYLYRHYFSYRTPTLQFRFALWLQQRLGLKRKFPAGFAPHFGSQWWALTIDTIKKIDGLSRQPAIRNFFKYTCIPDELFFQSLVAGLVPHRNIYGSNLTFYKFTPSGKPYVFYNDHFDFLTSQHYFFARKLSPHALLLREKLDAYCQQQIAAPAELGKNLAEIARHEAAELFTGAKTRIIAHADGDLGDLAYVDKDYIVIVCETNDAALAIGKAIETLGFAAIYLSIKSSTLSTAANLGNGLFPHNHPQLAEHDLANYLYYLLKRCSDRRPCVVVHQDHGMAKITVRHAKALIFNVQTTLEFSDNGALSYLFNITAGVGGAGHDSVGVSTRPIDVDNVALMAELFRTLMDRFTDADGMNHPDSRFQ